MTTGGYGRADAVARGPVRAHGQALDQPVAGSNCVGLTVPAPSTRWNCGARLRLLEDREAAAGRCERREDHVATAADVRRARPRPRCWFAGAVVVLADERERRLARC